MDILIVYAVFMTLRTISSVDCKFNVLLRKEINKTMACSSIKCEEFIFSKLHIQDIVLVAMVTAVMFVQPIPIFDKTGLNP
jgi:hypothetical protein